MLDLPLSLDLWHSLPEERKAEFLATLTDEEAGYFRYLWAYQARPDQLAPDFPGHPSYIDRTRNFHEPPKFRYWMALAGRGWGKSRSGAEWVRWKKDNCDRIALVGETAADVRDVMVEGESGILATSPPWDRPLYEPSKRQLTWNNGCIAKTYSGDDPEQLRGPQHSYAWVDELAKFRYAKDCMDQLSFGLRLVPKDGTGTQIFITTTPKPTPAIKKIIKDPRSIVVIRSTYDNVANLSEDFIHDLKTTYEGTSLGAQEIHAQVLDEAKGALWTREMIEATRIEAEKPADFYRETAIGVDPQTARQRNSTGIIGVSKGADGHGYVRGDATGDYKPSDWAKAACDMFELLDADYIVAEGNQGGEMVRHTIHSHNKNVPVMIVHARQGKQARAEPVQMLYQQNRVHHVGTWAQLEEQMVTWEPESGLASPDRLDALVWACRRLLISGAKDRRIAGGVPKAIAVNQ